MLHLLVNTQSLVHSNGITYILFLLDLVLYERRLRYVSRLAIYSGIISRQQHALILSASTGF